MTNSWGRDNKSTLTRLAVLVCIFLIFAALTAHSHHHKDETNHETCLICILINNISGIFISDPPSLIPSTIFCSIITAYQTFNFYHIQFFYNSRSPPFFNVYSNRSPSIFKGL
jgi:hypothetical protein